MSIFNYITLISTILMIFLILIQTRGATLGAGLGSSGEINIERRGTDKGIYQLTIVVAFTFAMSLLLSAVIG